MVPFSQHYPSKWYWTSVLQSILNFVKKPQKPKTHIDVSQERKVEGKEGGKCGA